MASGRVRLRALQSELQLLHALPIPPHDIAYMPYPIELDLELLDLRHDHMKPPNLGIRVIDEVARRIVVDHGNDLRLLSQVVELLRDLLHQPVKVAPQLREGAAVEHEHALRRGAAGGARGTRPAAGRLALRMLEDGDLVARKAKLGDGDFAGNG